MAAMAASIATVAAAASITSAASASVSLRALAPAAAFPRVRLGARPRSLSLRIRASAEEAGQTFSNVQKIIAEQLAVEADKVQPDTTFVDLGADSLDTVEIMMALEEKFDIQLDAEKGESIKTVKDAVGLIEETVAAAK